MTNSIKSLARVPRLVAAALIGFVVFMPTVTACSAPADDETEQVEEGSDSEESNEQENDSEEAENESNEED